jgi:hypothetical protein
MYTSITQHLNVLYVPRLARNPKSIHIGKVSYNTMYIIDFVEHRMLGPLNACGEFAQVWGKYWSLSQNIWTWCMYRGWRAIPNQYTQAIGLTTPCTLLTLLSIGGKVQSMCMVSLHTCGVDVNDLHKTLCNKVHVPRLAGDSKSIHTG